MRGMTTVRDSKRLRGQKSQMKYDTLDSESNKGAMEGRLESFEDV